MKPQFEVGKGMVGRGGVVRSASQHRLVLDDMVDFASSLGLEVCGEIASPITGKKGNQEFFLHLKWTDH